MRARNSLLRVARPCRSKGFAAARVICFMRVLPIFTYASDQYAANLFSLSLTLSVHLQRYSGVVRKAPCPGNLQRRLKPITTARGLCGLRHQGPKYNRDAERLW